MSQNIGRWIIVVISGICVLTSLNWEGINGRSVCHRENYSTHKQRKYGHFGESSHTPYDTQVLGRRRPFNGIEAIAQLVRAPNS